MGGSGDDRYRTPSVNVAKRIHEAREREATRLKTAVNEYLGELLTKFNARDTELDDRRLEDIGKVLHDVAAIEKLLLGGSVAKHTDVDGVSDLDALVILDRKDLAGKSPDEVRAAFFAELHDRMPRSEVKEVQNGTMAVTVRYNDDSEIQLLPALRSAGGGVAIPTPSGDGWTEVSPGRFQSALTQANQRLGRSLVPTIKLLKSMNSDLPEQKRLTGYHIEALAVDATRKYSGPNVPREVLIHVCKHAADRVLTPISDITGQSRRLDDYLGGSSSTQRRIASQALAGLARRLESAGSVAEWKAVFGSEE